MLLVHALEVDVRVLADVAVRVVLAQRVVGKGLRPTIDRGIAGAAGRDDRGENAHRALVDGAVAGAPDAQIVVDIGARAMLGAADLLGDLLCAGATAAD